MKNPIYSSALLIPYIALTSCASPTAQSEQDTWDQAISDRGSDLHASQDKSQITIPYLHNPSLEKAWGKPHLTVSKDGGYRLSYVKPDNSLEGFQVHGFKKPLPLLTSAPKKAEEVAGVDDIMTVYHEQSWKSSTLSLKGQKLPIRYFHVDSGGGADSPMDSSDTFSFTANGSTGYYVLKSFSMEGGSTTKRFQQVTLD